MSMFFNNSGTFWGSLYGNRVSAVLNIGKQRSLSEGKSKVKSNCNPQNFPLVLYNLFDFLCVANIIEKNEKTKTGDRYESASCFSYKSDMFISTYSLGRALGQVFSCP